MYNRYIPQPDGSFRRSRQPDAVPRREPTTPPSEPAPEPGFCPPPPPEPPCQQNPSCAHMRPPRQNRPAPPRPRQQPPAERKDPLGIGSFLRQLLPRDFDTEDLLVVLLLLLMSGDGGEDQNFALLTLGLYLFM